MNNLNEIKKIEIEKSNEKKDIDDTMSFMFKGYVNEFVKVIEQHFDKENLVNMYNNFSTLKIEFIKINSLRNLWWALTGSGGYNIVDNKIILNKLFFNNSISHELLHMSNCGEYKDIYYDGFSQFYSWKELPEEFYFSVGDGLNEGYTKVLEKRYFVDNYDMTINEVIMANLEKIFGEKVLSKYYFKGDLYGLVKLLKLFIEDTSIKDFINAMDYLEEHTLFKVKIIKCINKCFDFLITLYAKYELALYKAKIIKKEDCHNNIINYINDLQYEINSYLGYKEIDLALCKINK